MRRIIRRKKRFLFKIMLFIILFILVIGITYSYFSLSLHITGNIHGEDIISYTITPDSDPSLSINVPMPSKSIENGLYKYQYNTVVSNIGTTILDNFQVTITFNSNIQNISVTDFTYTSTSNTLTINNNKYTLSPNHTQNVTFVVFSTNPNLKIVSIKLTTTRNTTEVSLSDFPVDFTIASSSDTYTYQYDVKVTNKLLYKVSSWELNITLPQGTTFISGTNAVFAVINNVLDIKNASNNGSLNKNSRAFFTMQLQTNIVNFIPTVTKILVR